MVLLLKKLFQMKKNFQFIPEIKKITMLTKSISIAVPRSGCIKIKANGIKTSNTGKMRNK